VIFAALILTLKHLLIMKRIITLILCNTISIFIHAQGGLENVVVEKFYISNSSDTVANPDGGILPVNSVTYRIFADMLPGYKFQAAYGEDIAPFGGSPSPGDHELRILTSTLFFNNEDRGATTPTYTKVQSAKNTVMLDSYLSVGAACVGNFGILKSLDDTVATVVNNYVPQVLQNADTSAGIPIKDRDGMILVSGRLPESVTTVGISSEIAVFDNQNDGTNGPLFSTWNGSWASLNGSVGPDTIDNKVLIAQITTDGVLSFELNIQIGTPNGGVEKYVAKNPVGTEIQMNSLIQTFFPPSPVSAHDFSISKSKRMMIYPNPSTNFVMIAIDNISMKKDNAVLSIYDLTGREVIRKSLDIQFNKQLERIDLSNLSKGEYIIRVISDIMNESELVVVK
jgi:hypothetical protein